MRKGFMILGLFASAMVALAQDVVYVKDIYRITSFSVSNIMALDSLGQMELFYGGDELRPGQLRVEIELTATCYEGEDDPEFAKAKGDNYICISTPDLDIQALDNLESLMERIDDDIDFGSFLFEDAVSNYAFTFDIDRGGKYTAEANLGFMEKDSLFSFEVIERPIVRFCFSEEQDLTKVPITVSTGYPWNPAAMNGTEQIEFSVLDRSNAVVKSWKKNLAAQLDQPLMASVNTDQYDLSELKNGQYTLRVVVASLNLDSHFVFLIGDGEATGLTSLSRQSASSSVYDIYGRRSFKSGLHIENGKVVFK